MAFRIYAGLTLALLAPAAGAQDWLVAVDVPAVAGDQFVRPDQVVEIDGAASTPMPIVSGLPGRVSPVALAERNDGAICWSPSQPAMLADSQFATPTDAYCYLDGTFTRIFRGSDFGLKRSASITSISWNEAEILHLSFSVPVDLSGSLADPGTLVRVDHGALTIAPDSPALPGGTSISAATFDTENNTVLTPSAPVLVGGTLAHRLVLMVESAGSVSTDDTLAALFEQTRRTGLSGLHRRAGAVLEDLLFSDRFETP